MFLLFLFLDVCVFILEVAQSSKRVNVFQNENLFNYFQMLCSPFVFGFFGANFYGCWRACRVFVSCSKLAVEKAPSIRQTLSRCITEALDNAPSLVIFDDLDSIISSNSDSEGSQSSSPMTALTEFLTDIIDEHGVLILLLLLVNLYLRLESHQDGNVY